MNQEIKVRAIVLFEDKLLCVRQKPYHALSSSMNQYWNVPGGGLEKSESLLDCLKREMVEETGVMPIPGNLMYIQQFLHKGVEYLEFFFHVQNGQDYLHIDLSKTTHGELEIGEIKFIDPTTNDILPKFLVSESLFKKTNSPVTIFNFL